MNASSAAISGLRQIHTALDPDNLNKGSNTLSTNNCQAVRVSFKSGTFAIAPVIEVRGFFNDVSSYVVLGTITAQQNKTIELVIKDVLPPNIMCRVITEGTNIQVGASSITMRAQ